MGELTGRRHKALEKGKWQENRLVFAWEHLVKWPSPAWVQHLFKSKMRNSAVALTGFSGGDPYLFAEMLDAFDCSSKDSTESRVIVIDPNPSVLLRRLVRDHKLEDSWPVFRRPQCEECKGRTKCRHRCTDRSTFKEKMDAFYLDLYTSVVIELLMRNLDTIGLSTMSRLFGLNGRYAYKAADDLFSLLLELSGVACIRQNQVSAILFYFLPRVVSNSVILLGPLGVAPQEEDSERAIERRDYYYPLLADFSMAYAAMTFISRLLKTVPKDAEVLFRPDGVVDISAKGSGKCASVAPIIAIRRSEAMNSDKRYKENIVKSRFFRLYPRDHAIDPLIIEPTDPHEPRFRVSVVDSVTCSITYRDIGPWVSSLMSFAGGHQHVRRGGKSSNRGLFTNSVAGDWEG